MFTVTFKRGVSSKTGNPYVMMIINGPNHFEYKVFAKTDAERFMFEHAAAELGI